MTESKSQTWKIGVLLNRCFNGIPEPYTTSFKQNTTIWFIFTSQNTLWANKKWTTIKVDPFCIKDWIRTEKLFAQIFRMIRKEKRFHPPCLSKVRKSYSMRFVSLLDFQIKLSFCQTFHISIQVLWSIWKHFCHHTEYFTNQNESFFWQKGVLSKADCSSFVFCILKKIKKKLYS